MTNKLSIIVKKYNSILLTSYFLLISVDILIEWFMSWKPYGDGLIYIYIYIYIYICTYVTYITKTQVYFNNTSFIILSLIDNDPFYNNMLSI